MDEEDIQVGINDETVPLPQKPVLRQAYPNPFNNSTRIEFSISRQGHVGLEIYDMNGKWVTSLVKNHLFPGTHSINWKGIGATGNPVSSGSYLVVMKYGGFTTSKKIVFLK